MSECSIAVLGSWVPADSPALVSWLALLDTPYELLYGYDLNWRPRDGVGLIVSTQQYIEPDVTLLRKAVEADIPTLMLADGILEYRNTWANPGFAPGCIFQPVLTHKLACIGASQARIVEQWGNPGKCEIVGAPRLDRQLARRSGRRSEGAAFRLLVTTARTPGFTPSQMGAALQGLSDLKAWLDRVGYCIDDRRIDVTWRLTCGLDESLGVKSRVTETQGVELGALLTETNALITTPSTTILEGMLQDIPVAVLDYTNSPPYVQCAWSITARDHLDSVLPGLVAPSEARMLYQRSSLHDSLACLTPAAPRLARLVESMVKIGADCRAAGTPVTFPPRILAGDEDGAQSELPVSPPHALYPGSPVFIRCESMADRVELEHLRRCAASQDRRIGELEAQLATRNMSEPPSLRGLLRHRLKRWIP